MPLVLLLWTALLQAPAPPVAFLTEESQMCSVPESGDGQVFRMRRQSDAEISSGVVEIETWRGRAVLLHRPEDLGDPRTPTLGQTKLLE